MKLTKTTAASGYGTYIKTIGEHSPQAQREKTLLLTNAMLPLVREQVSGFAEMEGQLVDWLQSKYSTVVELFYAHGLRQSPETGDSSLISVHQDTEDYDFIEYTVVVKLTADEPFEAPSSMRVTLISDPNLAQIRSAALLYFGVHMIQHPES